MFYQLYELNHAFLSPARALNDAVRLYYKNPLNPLSHTPFGRQIAAGGDVFERLTRRYAKPEFELTQTEIDGHTVAVTQEVVWERPFCRLLHFARALPKGTPRQPNLVIVAPMSGHYATLLRGTVATLLPTHEVYVTDWADARMVPLASGRFDLDDYIDYVTDIVRHFRGDVHMVAVCQPAVPVFAATALMEADGGVHPKSITLMGGPIDTRENPTEVNIYAAKHSLDWFRRNVIQSVPFPHPGMMRQVYPGFLQLTGFMTMNLDRHLSAHYNYFDHLVKGDGEPAEKHRDFYDEYLSVMDLTAEFYLQTVDTVFLRQALPRGLMQHRDRTVDPQRITRTAIFTVEGENDDISGIGQTRAAHKLTPNLPEERHGHYEQAGVGHYGVFNGSRFRREIAPRIAEWIARWDASAPALGVPAPDPTAAAAGTAQAALEAAAAGTEAVTATAATITAAAVTFPTPAAAPLKARPAEGETTADAGSVPEETAEGGISPEEAAEDAVGAWGGDRDIASTPEEADQAAEEQQVESDASPVEDAQEHAAGGETRPAVDVAARLLASTAVLTVGDQAELEPRFAPAAPGQALPAPGEPATATAAPAGSATFLPLAKPLALATPIDAADVAPEDTATADDVETDGAEAQPGARLDGIAGAATAHGGKRKFSFRRS